MTYIPFKSDIAKQKPSTLLNSEFKCPFCDRSALRKEQEFLKETEDFLIVKNKYPVMQNSFATVLIEHNLCDEHIGTYSLDYLTNLLNFALDYYEELESLHEFSSIAFFKNHGIFSGGSIKHSHMQLIGFKDKNYKGNIKPDDFIGETIIKNEQVEWNISSFPRSEGYEFNLILKDLNRIDVLAFYIQKTVQYILNVLNTKYQCYNLAFFIEDDIIKVKIFSRGTTSVVLLGYGIHQTPNNLKEIATELNSYTLE